MIANLRELPKDIRRRALYEALRVRLGPNAAEAMEFRDSSYREMEKALNAALLVIAVHGPVSESDGTHG